MIAKPTKAREARRRYVDYRLDYHPIFQQIAFFETETGESGERRLVHGDQKAEDFYRALKEQGANVRVGAWKWLRQLFQREPNGARLRVYAGVRPLIA